MTYKLVKLHKFIDDLTEERKVEISDSEIIEEPTLKTKTHYLEVKTIVNGSNIKVKKRVLLKEGDLVFAKLHTQNGAFAFAKKDFKSTTTFIPCKVDILQCREDYLYIVLDKYIKFLEITNDGVGRETFKSSDILNLEIPLPSLEEQEKIVKKLESINSKIEKIKLEKNKNYIKILREQILKQAIEGKLVKQNPNDEPASILLEKIKQEKEKLIKEGKLKKEKELEKITEDEIPFEIPENWVWCKLNDVNIIKGGKRMPMGANFSSFETKYIYIRVSDMKNGTIDKSDLKYIDEEIYKKLKQYNINSTDIYMTIVGATIGKCGLIPEELDGMILTENATKLTPLKVNKKFLYFLFTSSFCQDQFIDKTKQVGVQKMSLERFKNTLIPLPPLEEQKRIVEKIEDFEEKLNKLDKLQTKQLKELEALKNAVLDKALSGELI